MTIQLSHTQHAVLAHAAQNTNGKITWFPDNVKGGARQKVLTGLFNRVLITSDGADHFVATEGYDALGLTRPTAALVPVVAPVDADPELETAVASVEAQWALGDGGLEIVWRDQGWQALAGELLPGTIGAELQELEETV